MKYVDEYRDPELAEGVVSAIREKSHTPVRFMEVCGTHTVAIFRSGLKEIISALLLPALILDGEPKYLDLLRPEFWVALPTFAFAWWTRSLGGTVVVGMLLFWLAGKVDPMWFAGL